MSKGLIRYGDKDFVYVGSSINAKSWIFDREMVLFGVTDLTLTQAFRDWVLVAPIEFGLGLSVRIRSLIVVLYLAK